MAKYQTDFAKGLLEQIVTLDDIESEESENGDMYG